MVGLNLDWKVQRQYWHYDDSLRVVIHDDAPESFVESYKEYLKQIKELKTKKGRSLYK